MKRLIILLVMISGGFHSSTAQRSDDIDHPPYNTLSASGYILSYFDNSGFVLSAERSIVTYVDLTFRAGFTRSDKADATTLLCGVNWITSVSQKSNGIIKNESYLGFYPLAYTRFDIQDDQGSRMEHFYYPTSVMGYKLIFWKALVMDMYIGANLAIPLSGTNDEIQIGGLMAGIGLGYRF